MHKSEKEELFSILYLIAGFSAVPEFPIISSILFVAAIINFFGAIRFGWKERKEKKDF